jgi:hypothetical protein
MFAEMPLDNRTVVKLTAAAFGLFGRSNRPRARNDLIFRRGE